MKLLITWMVCIWASNDMKVNCIVEESKIRWISRKKKKDGSAYSLQLHGSLSEFLVSFRPLWTVPWFIFDYQEALCILIKTLDWVFIFRIVLDWSWVFFFEGLIEAELWTYQTVVLLLPSTLLSYWRYGCLPSYSVYLPVCFNAVLLLANDTL